jgi:hypothetical protein
MLASTPPKLFSSYIVVSSDTCPVFASAIGCLVVLSLFIFIRDFAGPLHLSHASKVNSLGDSLHLLRPLLLELDPLFPA